MNEQSFNTDLSDDLIDKIWESEDDAKIKLRRSLEEFDLRPTYQLLTTMWLNYGLSRDQTTEATNRILDKYLVDLSNPEKNLTESMEYSLYFDIFEDPDRNEHAWQYFLERKPSDHFLRIMLRNSGPIPYFLKENLWKELIHDQSFHADIYKSIRSSCFDNCGTIDRAKALTILRDLKLSTEMDALNSERGRHRFEEVIKYLETNGS